MEEEELKEIMEEHMEDFFFHRQRDKLYSLYLKRRLQLIIRDPLAKEIIKRYDELPPWVFDDGEPGDLLELKWKLEEKWDVTIYPTRSLKWFFSQRNEPYDDFVDPKGEYPLTIRFHSDRFRMKPIRVYRFGWPYPTEFKITGKPEDKPEDNKIIFELDLNLIDRHDARWVKKTLWEYIERYLKKKKKVNYDFPYLIRLYNCKEETFNKYLKWYDLHVNEKLGFRLIALIENGTFKDGATPNKIIWGKPVRGEDKIEKGIKLIWKAIHRSEYSPKKVQPTIERYNCPEHKESCPLTCNYLESWMHRFNRLNPALK